MRRYPEAEYTKIEGQPLSPMRLAAIQRALPEHERFGFLLALTEEIADQVLAATIKAAPAAVLAEGKRT